LGPLWLETFRHNRWANLRLLDYCATLTDDQLQLGARGTYGTVAATLQHLLAAEQRYVRQLGGGDALLSEADEFPGVPVLKELADGSGDALLAIAASVNPDDTFEREFRDVLSRVSKGVVLIQALHHGNDHRAHIGTILGQNGLSTPPLDVWEYGLSMGFITRLNPHTASG
jgi:uncharacterized damage-inducible protein DinB